MWLAIEQALGVNAAPRAQPGEVGVRLPPGDRLGDLPRREPAVAWRMYEAMFSFGTWQLSELNRASLTGLQVGTLILAYLVLAFFVRQFYSQPIADQGAQSRGEQRRSGRRRPGRCPAARPARGRRRPGGDRLLAERRAGLPAELAQPVARLATRLALLLLFAASVLKLSAQSCSPFLYFSSRARPAC